MLGTRWNASLPERFCRMDTTKPNLPAPAIEFRCVGNQGLDASARLDWMADGLCVDFHEVWGADEYLCTVSRPGLRVTFVCSLFHLSALSLALSHYVERVHKERLWPTVDALIEKRSEK